MIEARLCDVFVCPRYLFIFLYPPLPPYLLVRCSGQPLLNGVGFVIGDLQFHPARAPRRPSMVYLRDQLSSSVGV